VASIEKTAYPQFRYEPTVEELQDSFTPTQDEIKFVRSLARSEERVFTAVLMLKCVQQIGYFPTCPKFPLQL
jgi:hypothetical protein